MITTVQMNLKNEKSYLFLYQHDKKKKKMNSKLNKILFIFIISKHLQSSVIIDINKNIILKENALNFTLLE